MAGQPTRILIVEDDAVLRSVLDGFCLHMGCVPTIVAKCEEALRLFHAQTFDMIFMDSQLEGIDGLMCAKKIRELEAGGERHIPIISMTAHVLAEHQRAVKLAGMDDFLGKPFTMSAFREMVQKHAPR